MTQLPPPAAGTCVATTPAHPDRNAWSPDANAGALRIGVPVEGRRFLAGGTSLEPHESRLSET